MAFAKSLDSLYTSKKEIDNIISGNLKNENLNRLLKSRNLKLEDILKNEIEVRNDSPEWLAISTGYKTRYFEPNLADIIDGIQEIKEFSQSTYKTVKFDLSKKGDTYNIYALDDKNDFLFSFNISKNKSSDEMTDIFLYTIIYKKFAENPSFSRELFTVINGKILKQVEKTYSNILVEGQNSVEEGSTLTDQLKNLGLEIYQSDINMHSIGGYQDIKDRIEREIFTPFMHKDILNSIRKLTRTNLKNDLNSALFYGEPGTGKTMMAKVISNENKLNFIYMNISQIYSHWYGDSPKRMESAFELVKEYSKQNGKTVLFIDEIDSLGNRQYNSSESNKVLNVLLTKLSGIKSEENDDLLLIGCTNLIDSLDQALLSRFKSRVYFRKPNEEDRKEIIRTYSQKLTPDEISLFAKKTDDLTGRDIESIASITEENLAYDIANKKKDYYTPKLEDYLKAAGLFREHSAEEKKKNSGMYM